MRYEADVFLAEIHPFSFTSHAKDVQKHHFRGEMTETGVNKRVEGD